LFGTFCTLKKRAKLDDFCVNNSYLIKILRENIFLGKNEKKVWKNGNKSVVLQVQNNRPVSKKEIKRINNKQLITSLWI